MTQPNPIDPAALVLAAFRQVDGHFRELAALVPRVPSLEPIALDAFALRAQALGAAAELMARRVLDLSDERADL